tara:strand:- start:4930 stop:7026 length:2097 start_codon:yes stop_codon:yes gene_type:complete
MSYRDVTKAIDQYSDILSTTDWANKGNKLAETYKGTGGTNPNSSGAYIPSKANIYDNIQPVVDPRSMFSDYKPDLLTRAGSGLTGYKMGQGLDPFAKSIAGTLGATAPGSFGPASFLYGATRNSNPYDFTQTESLGTIGSTALAARSLAPTLNPILSKAMPLAAASAATPLMMASAAPAAAYGAGLVGPAAAPAAAGMGTIAGMHPALLIGSLLLGGFFSKKGKKRAAAANKKVEDDIMEQQTQGYEDRSKKLLDQRSEYMSDLSNQSWMQSQNMYDNQYGGNYSTYRGDEGMKFSPKELNKIAKAGRNGDTMLAHVNPQEAALLKALGGSGTKNPYTGMPEYGYGNVVSSLLNPVADIFSGASNIVNPILSPVLGAGSDALGVVQDVATPIVEAGGNLVSAGVDTAVDVGTGALKTGGAIASDAMLAANQVIEPVLQPIMSTAMDIADPFMDIIEDVTTPIMGGIHDFAKGTIEGGFDLVQGVGDLGLGILGGINDFLFPGSDPYSAPQIQPRIEPDRSVKARAPGMVGEKKTGKGVTLSGLEQKDQGGQDFVLNEGDWMSDKDNPFIRENVELYNKGGKANIVAEFTGNELIVNNQDAVEKGIAVGNYAMAAAPIKKAMKDKKITPGPETHKNNPMPVDAEGNIYYEGGGKLNFKVNKGAGIYDHATDQFKPNMTDKEIAMVAKKNIAKWKSNGMA